MEPVAASARNSLRRIRENCWKSSGNCSRKGKRYGQTGSAGVAATDTHVIASRSEGWAARIDILPADPIDRVIEIDGRGKGKPKIVLRTFNRANKTI